MLENIKKEGKETTNTVLWDWIIFFFSYDKANEKKRLFVMYLTFLSSIHCYLNAIQKTTISFSA